MRQNLSTVIDITCALIAVFCAYAYWHVVAGIPAKQAQAWEMGRASIISCGKATLL